MEVLTRELFGVFNRVSVDEIIGLARRGNLSNIDNTDNLDNLINLPAIVNIKNVTLNIFNSSPFRTLYPCCLQIQYKNLINHYLIKVDSQEANIRVDFAGVLIRDFGSDIFWNTELVESFVCDISLLQLI